MNIDPTKTFEDKVNTWTGKWASRKAIDKNWKQFVKRKDVKPGKMYGIIKTHKESIPARVITSDSGTTVESLSIFVEKYLFPEGLKIDAIIQDTQHIKHS